LKTADFNHLSGNISSLDGLRGVAALVVLISHCANRGYLPAFLGQGFGQMGVALFYSLSGLLMAKLYLGRKIDLDALRIFIWRRGARVLPLYYFALSIGALFLWINISPFEIESSRDIIRAGLMLHGTGVLWSIPVEIQFYCIFVLIWYFSSKGHLIKVLSVLTVLQMSLVVTQYFLGVKEFSNLSFWLHIFILGVVLGKLSTSENFLKYFADKRFLLNIISFSLIACAFIAPPGVREYLNIPRTYIFIDPISMGYPIALLATALFNTKLYRPSENLLML